MIPQLSLLLILAIWFCGYFGLADHLRRPHGVD